MIYEIEVINEIELIGFMSRFDGWLLYNLNYNNDST